MKNLESLTLKNNKYLNISPFIDKETSIFDFIRKQNSTKTFLFILIIFILVIIINYYFSTKFIHSFIPLIILIYLFYLYFLSIDKDELEKKKYMIKFIDDQKFPMIYKYNEFLSIISEINYLKYFNENAFYKSLYYTNSYLLLYDFVVNHLQSAGAKAEESYIIVENGQYLLSNVLNQLMSIIINIPPYNSYIQNINIPNGFIDNIESKIKKLQDLFINFQLEIQNYVNKLLNSSVNIHTHFFYDEDLIIKPNPTYLLDYSPNFDLY